MTQSREQSQGVEWILLKHSVAAGYYWGWLYFHVLRLGPLCKQQDSFSGLEPENALTSWSKYKLRLKSIVFCEHKGSTEAVTVSMRRSTVSNVMHEYERLCGWFIFCTWTFSWHFLFNAAHVCLSSPSLMSHRRGMFTRAAAVKPTKTHMCKMVKCSFFIWEKRSINGR